MLHESKGDKDMAYTSVNIYEPGPAFDGLTPGTPEQLAILGQALEIMARNDIESVWNGYVGGIGANVSIAKSPSRDVALRVQAEMQAAGYVKYRSASEGIPLEDFIGIFAG